MPLNEPGLASALAANFAAPGPDFASCAAQWASAVQSYASGIVPVSTTVAAAAATLGAALAAAFASPDAAPGMEAAFAAFAAAVGLGMVGYTPVPPAGSIGFSGQFAGPKPLTHAQAGSEIAALIQAWMTTGTGTLIAPPNTVVPWN